MSDGPILSKYALAIRPIGRIRFEPVVYDLNSDSTEVGAAADNHIVLNGPGVEPYHLVMRQIDGQLYAMVNQATARDNGEKAWLEARQGDSFYCPEHGHIPTPRKPGRCPLCRQGGGPVWLLRPIQAGDAFSIGEGYEASVLSQGAPNAIPGEGEGSNSSPWPDTTWLSTVPSNEGALPTDDDLPIQKKEYPVGDSNLWVWSPPESPTPVFMHQRVNRHVTRHACDNMKHEVGGVLLGHVYQEPQDKIEYPVITHALTARFATEARGHLTFTRSTWLDINRKREERYPDKKIVGWYHTHPGLDIFLSEWDLFIHKNFFRQPWQVALVIDPHLYKAGFFVWSGNAILDPQRPHQLFKLADLENDRADEHHSRVRIKLGERVT
jgi:proteasome lid subunit RPN8/RPN11